MVRAHVNCCQVLHCLRAQHPLCCPSWLIWVGSILCHSLVLTCCPHGLVRKVGPLPTEARKTQCQNKTQCQIWHAWVASISKGLQGWLLTPTLLQRKEGISFLFQRRHKIEWFSVFIFKRQGVRKKWNRRQESKKEPGEFYSQQAVFKRGFFLC